VEHLVYYFTYSIFFVADLWRQIIANPSMEDHVRKPDVLSFHIGSKLPVSEYQRQKLLELDGTSYRLQKEIQILKGFNLIKCRYCQVCCFHIDKVFYNPLTVGLLIYYDIVRLVFYAHFSIHNKLFLKK
jgi:hypothetical protein